MYFKLHITQWLHQQYKSILPACFIHITNKTDKVKQIIVILSTVQYYLICITLSRVQLSLLCVGFYIYPDEPVCLSAYKLKFQELIIVNNAHLHMHAHYHTCTHEHVYFSELVTIHTC